MPRDTKFALIAGNSFSGSLLAWILQRNGYSVYLVDRGKHPRFAIGESSTPTADFLIASIADRWRLPEIAPLACWGSWKKAHPQIRCGKKRGFSYFGHEEGKPFNDTPNHDWSLLVAASSSDTYSDTHWLREDVDHFFFQSAVAEGATPYENACIVSVEWNPKRSEWIVDIQVVDGSTHRVNARWLVDASGGGGAFAKWLGQSDDSDWMRTRTGALYGHVEGLAPFTPVHYPAHELAVDPFCGDDSAQHHVLNSGWYWVLRFDHEVTSIGLVQPSHHWPTDFGSMQRRDEYWKSMRKRYPSIDAMCAKAQWQDSTKQLLFRRRLSRCVTPFVGQNWLALPTSAGFIDPLHSSGIAHALSGVARVAEILIFSDVQPSGTNASLRRYSEDLQSELRWLDLLVAGCYQGLPSFRRFRAFASFYFVAAILFENQMAQDPWDWQEGFMTCKNGPLVHAAEQAYAASEHDHQIEDEEFECLAASMIRPWNRVGLLDKCHLSRLQHTNAPKYKHLVP